MKDTYVYLKPCLTTVVAFLSHFLFITCVWCVFDEQMLPSVSTFYYYWLRMSDKSWSVQLINRNNLNWMKKAMRKVPVQLIVDQFQRIKKPPLQLQSKPSHSSSQHPSIKVRVEEVACKHCCKYVPQAELMHHQRMCSIKQEEEDYFFVNRRPQHKQKNDRQEQSIRKERVNDDYFPQEDNPSNVFNRPKRPMSALNKKHQLKQKVQPKQTKLKKAASSSKLKEEPKKSYEASKEKGQKPSSKYEHIYLKNTAPQKKHPLSIGTFNTSKLKKKNVNAPHRFISSEQQSIEEKPQRPFSRSKRQEEKIRNEFQKQLESYMTTKKLKEIVHDKLKNDHHQQRERHQQPKRESTQRQPIRTEQRNQREPQRQSRPRPRQPRQQRQQRRRANENQPRNPDFQRYPRRSQQRACGGPSIMQIVSQTINNQLQMMKQFASNDSSQFSMMTNMFQNFNSFVNINIGPHPNYYFTNHEEIHSSSDYDSDSSNTYSSDYDDYYDPSEPEGMDEQQLNSIQNKKYRAAQQGQHQCTICLVELKNGDTIKQLFCEHMFHSECIEQWLRRKSACPVCRDQLGNN